MILIKRNFSSVVLALCGRPILNEFRIRARIAARASEWVAWVGLDSHHLHKRSRTLGGLINTIIGVLCTETDNQIMASNHSVQLHKIIMLTPIILVYLNCFFIKLHCHHSSLFVLFILIFTFQNPTSQFSLGSGHLKGWVLSLVVGLLIMVLLLSGLRIILTPRIVCWGRGVLVVIVVASLSIKIARVVILRAECHESRANGKVGPARQLNKQAHDTHVAREAGFERDGRGLDGRVRAIRGRRLGRGRCSSVALGCGVACCGQQRLLLVRRQLQADGRKWSTGHLFHLNELTLWKRFRWR